MSAPATTQGPAAHSVVLLDGAMGTELIARGLELTVESPERWVLTRPEVVRAVHAEYAAAGAQVLQTNTFGGSRPRLVRHGLDGELARIHRDSLALARAGGPGLPVYASLGPTGIDPYAAGSAEAMRAAYEEQIAALVGPGGADGLHFETMLHPLEAVAGVRAARSVAPRVRVIVSSTYALGDHGFQTPFGIPVDEMVRAVVEAGPDALGINCSLEARKMLGLVRRHRELSSLPLVVQPQGGPTDVECRGPRAPALVEEFVEGVMALVELGVVAVGGCCGAGPAHIRALAGALSRSR